MIGGFQVGPFQKNYQQVAPVIAVGAQPSGVRKYRVRRSDFSSQENYEFALRAALANANVAIRAEIVAEVIPAKIADTAIKVSAKTLAKLQNAPTMDESELMHIFMMMDE